MTASSQHSLLAQDDGPWNDVSEDQVEVEGGPADVDEGEGGDQAAEGDGGGDINKPTSKTELQALRQRYTNTMHLVHHLYKNIDLRDDIRMVACAVYWYMHEYTTTLDDQKKSQEHYA